MVSREHLRVIARNKFTENEKNNKGGDHSRRKKKVKTPSEVMRRKKSKTHQTFTHGSPGAAMLMNQLGRNGVMRRKSM